MLFYPTEPSHLYTQEMPCRSTAVLKSPLNRVVSLVMVTLPCPMTDLLHYLVTTVLMVIMPQCDRLSSVPLESLNCQTAYFTFLLQFPPCSRCFV